MPAPPTSLGSALPVHYNLGLVSISLLLVVLGFFALLGVLDRYRAASTRKGLLLWWVAGTVIVSAGTWAMHFIGMLAVEMPVHVTYDLRLTAISLLPNMIVFGLWGVFFTPNTSRLRGLVFGIFGALGVAAMHFIGMMAMRGVEQRLIMQFDPMLLNLAAGLGTLIFYLALRYYGHYVVPATATQPSSLRERWVLALLQGTGVATMHYMAMAATTFYPTGSATGYAEMALSPFVLALLVAFASFLVTALLAILTVIDRRLQEAALEAQTSRARMVEAIESISDGFVLFDRDDRLVVCNQRYRELMDSGEPMEIGMSFEQILWRLAQKGVVAEAAGRTEAWLTDRLARHLNPCGYLVEQWRDNRWFQTSERRVWNIGTVAIMTDITDVKQAEFDKQRHLEQEQLYREEAIRQEATIERHRSLTQMVAGVAHEINTPLGVASTALSVIENRLADMASVMNANAEHREIVEDLLDSGDLLKRNIHRAHRLVESFKRISVDQLTDVRERVSLPKLVHDIVELYRPTARQAKLDITVDCSAIGEGEWFGCAAYLTQVLLNLLQNVERYAYPNRCGGQVDIVLREEVEASKEHYLLRVEDHGAGIAPELLPQIFNPFFTTGRALGGTGLGLALVHNLVTSALGGSIVVESEPHRGTVFLLSIPKVVPELKMTAGSFDIARG